MIILKLIKPFYNLLINNMKFQDDNLLIQFKYFFIIVITITKIV